NGLKRSWLQWETLEDRTLLSIQCAPGPYVVPTNLTDINRGSVGSNFVPIEPFISVNPTNPANLAISQQTGLELSLDAGATLVGGTPVVYPVANNGSGGGPGNCTAMQRTRVLAYRCGSTTTRRRWAWCRHCRT